MTPDGRTPQAVPGPGGGPHWQGISPREFSRAIQAPEAAIPGEACDYCGQPVPRRRRGRPGKFHPTCRRAFDREARRAGGQVLRRRRARARAPLVRRAPLTARAKRVLAFLVAAGSVLTGIPIPPQARGFLAPRRARAVPEQAGQLQEAGGKP